MCHALSDVSCNSCRSVAVCYVSLQSAAELKVAASFACHPLMAAAVAACQEETGSICLVMPYAGVSVAHILHDPDWRTKLTEEERTEVFAEMAAHGMAVHEELQREVWHGAALTSSVQPCAGLSSTVGLHQSGDDQCVTPLSGAGSAVKCT